MKKLALATLVALLLVGNVVPAQAGVSDSWITTKAKIALLTTDGFSVNGANVDTVDGHVTLHGKVSNAADRARAEQTVRQVNGVKSVKNLLQVVPESMREQVKANDAEVKERVEASLKLDDKMDDVKVASVNNGVVLLSGKTESLTEALRAIMNAYSVSGVHRVASEIQTLDN